jgi:hypothetical protein
MSKKEQTMPSNKTELRALVAQMTADYLAAGGTITKIKSGRRALDVAIDETSTEKVSGKV